MKRETPNKRFKFKVILNQKTIVFSTYAMKQEDAQLKVSKRYPNAQSIEHMTKPIPFNELC